MAKPVQGSQTSKVLAASIQKEPDGIAELVRIMEQDYQVQLAKLTISSNVKTAKVMVSAESDDERSQSLADSLTTLWYDSLRAMLDCFAYGRVAFEKVWQWDSESMLDLIWELKPLPYELTSLELDEEGNFAGITLQGKTSSEPITLDPEYSWWLALDPEALNPYGKSRYLGAPYKSFRDRQVILRLRDTFVKRFIFQGGIAHTPDAVEVDGVTYDAMTLLKEAYNDLAAGGFIRLPNDRKTNADGSDAGHYEWDFERVEFKVNSADPVLQVINAMDSEQLLAFGIPPKTVIEGDSVGSFALVSQQMLILYSVVEDIVNQIASSFQSHVVDPCAEINGLSGLVVNYTPLTERPDDLASELVKTWLTTPQLSPVLTSGAIDLKAIFDAVGIAVTADASERLQAMIDRLKTVPTQPPSPGGFNLTPTMPPFLLGTR